MNRVAFVLAASDNSVVPQDRYTWGIAASSQLLQHAVVLAFDPEAYSRNRRWPCVQHWEIGPVFEPGQPC